MLKMNVLVKILCELSSYTTYKSPISHTLHKFLGTPLWFLYNQNSSPTLSFPELMWNAKHRFINYARHGVGGENHPLFETSAARDGGNSYAHSMVPPTLNLQPPTFCFFVGFFFFCSFIFRFNYSISSSIAKSKFSSHDIFFS